MSTQTCDTLDWAYSPRIDRHKELVIRGEHANTRTGFELRVDHHWDTGAATEYLLYRAGEEVPFASLPTMAEAEAFAEATYTLENPQ